MSSEQDIISSYESNTGDYFSKRNVYSRVYALLIHWDENDLRPEKEVTALGGLLKDGFGFATDTLKLPPSNPESVLVTKIMAVRDEHSAKDSLLIVYYAGHCYPDQLEHARWKA